MKLFLRRCLCLLLVSAVFCSLGCVLAKDDTVEAEESYFTAYFLDVGQGDAAVVDCDGHIMVIDGGSSNYSSYVYSFLKSHSFKRVDYLVATHPDADHIGGLSAVLNYSSVGIAFCNVEAHDTPQFSDFLKYLDKQNNAIVVPDKGDVFSLGSAKVSILSPNRGEIYSDNTSVVLRIEYGDTSFLFTGDAEVEDEAFLLSSEQELSSTVLKVGHHGSSSSTSAAFLSRVSPEYAVISVGADNTYGHPADEVIARLKKSGAQIFRTDKNGLITAFSDGKTVSFSVEKGDSNPLVLIPFTTEGSENAESRSLPAQDNSEEDTSVDYIVNTNTKKFHYPTCKSVSQMKEKNKMYYSGTRDELIEQGYEPCGNCHP